MRLDHLEIATDIDTDLASKLAGSRFSVLKGDMAKLQRDLLLALCWIMQLRTDIKNIMFLLWQTQNH